MTGDKVRVKMTCRRTHIRDRGLCSVSKYAAKGVVVHRFSGGHCGGLESDKPDRKKRREEGNVEKRMTTI